MKSIVVSMVPVEITAIKACFETGCYVYHFNVLMAGNFQIANAVTSL